MLRTISTAALIAVMGALPAWAATVEPVQSPVSVNKGSGFATVARQATVNAGDSVMAGPGGKATVNFGNGCVVTVEPGTVYNVPAGNPCESAAMGGGGGAGLAIGAAVAVGVGVVAISGQGKSKPASP